MFIMQHRKASDKVSAVNPFKFPSVRSEGDSVVLAGSHSRKCWHTLLYKASDEVRSKRKCTVYTDSDKNKNQSMLS